MTRGTFVFISNEEVFQSMEFNGDMYMDGYGEDAVKALLSVSDIESFKDGVETFNKEHHNYKDEDPRQLYGCKRNWLDNIGKDYYTRWFSDYLFIKNCGEDLVTVGTISDENSKSIKNIEVKTDEILVLHFGELHVKFSPDGEVLMHSKDYEVN